MRPGRFGGFLLATGALVGVAAVIGLVVGFEPSRLPPALLDIAAYKLTFLAAGGLLAAGAIVRRRANREERESRAARALGEDANPGALGLPEGRAPDEVRVDPPAARVPRQD